MVQRFCWCYLLVWVNQYFGESFWCKGRRWWTSVRIQTFCSCNLIYFAERDNWVIYYIEHIQKQHNIWLLNDAHIQCPSRGTSFPWCVQVVVFFLYIWLPAFHLFFPLGCICLLWGKGGMKGRAAVSELCKTFQRPTLLYPKLCICQALKRGIQSWISLLCCIQCHFLFLVTLWLFDIW